MVGEFWFSGQPGLGKSTFMKFLADHASTSAALMRWASRGRLVLASHYFWSAGTPMQKSRQGLLQTLLCDVFQQLPDLIEAVCVERWSLPTGRLAHETWALPELQRILRRIADLDVNARFCFFIDGLDEFEGDHVDFCRDLTDLARSPHIKLCISSRPWNCLGRYHRHGLGPEDENRAFHLRRHSRWVKFMVFSLNGKLLVSGSMDETVRIWDADSGQQFAAMEENLSCINSVAFSIDGKSVAASSTDQVVRI